MSLKYVIEVVDNGTSKLKKFAGEAEKSTGKMSGMGKAAGVAGAALAAGAAAALGMATAYTALTVKVAANQDALAKQAKSLGVSVEWLSAMRFAAERSGATQEQLGVGMVKLSKNMNEAATGNKTAMDSFRALGVSVTNTDGTLRKSEAVFADVAEAFSKMENGAHKAALAQEIFGKGGVPLVNVLNEGKAGLQALTKEAERLGIVVGTDAAAAAETFSDAWGDVRMSLDGALRGVVDGSMQDMTIAVQSLTDMIAENKDTFASIGQSIGTGVRAALPALQSMLDFVAEIGEGWSNIIRNSKGDELVAQLEKVDGLVNKIKSGEGTTEAFKARGENFDEFVGEVMWEITELSKLDKQLATAQAKRINAAMKFWQQEQIDFGGIIGTAEDEPKRRRIVIHPEIDGGGDGKIQAATNSGESEDKALKTTERYRKSLSDTMKTGEAMASNTRRRLDESFNATIEKATLAEEMRRIAIGAEEAELEDIRNKAAEREAIAQNDATLLAQIDFEKERSITETKKRFAKERTEAERAESDRQVAITIDAMGMTLSAMKGFGADARAMMIGEAMLNIYGGAAKALNSQFPLSIFAWAQVAGIGAQLIRDMKSVKMATGGDVIGPSHAQGGVTRELEGGEAVVPRRTAQEFGGFQGIMRALQTGRGGGAINVTLNNPIGTREWFEREAVPMLEKAAARR